MSSGRLFQATGQPRKMPGYRVVAMFWVLPINNYKQRNEEQNGWEQSNWMHSSLRHGARPRIALYTSGFVYIDVLAPKSKSPLKLSVNRFKTCQRVYKFSRKKNCKCHTSTVVFPLGFKYSLGDLTCGANDCTSRRHTISACTPYNKLPKKTTYRLGLSVREFSTSYSIIGVLSYVYVVRTNMLISRFSKSSKDVKLTLLRRVLCQCMMCQF